MKKWNVLFIAALSVTACSKKDSPIQGKPQPDETEASIPEMQYTDLRNTFMKRGLPQYVDLDKDGSIDIGFDTWFIGNPNEHEDEVLFFAQSNVHSLLLMDTTTESTPGFNEGDVIPVQQLPAHHQWYLVSLAELAKKNTPVSNVPYWEGFWKQAQHQYLAIQVIRNGQQYYGWIELSFDTAGERLILHKAGISKIPGEAVRAGK